MTWPAGSISTTNLDAGGDSAASARADLLDAIQKVNQIIAHVSAFMQTMLTRTDGAGVRGDIGLTNHQLVTVDSSGNVSTAGTITGANVASTSDERLKEEWRGLPDGFVALLADVRAGTFQRKATPGKRFAGVSAQSLREVLPEAVEEGEDGFLAVSYGPAALVACVALAREIQALGAEVRQLKGEQ